MTLVALVFRNLRQRLSEWLDRRDVSSFDTFVKACRAWEK